MTWRATFRFDQPQTVIPDDWPQVGDAQSAVTIFDVILDAHGDRPEITRLVGCCHGDMTGSTIESVATGAYGRVVIERMGKMIGPGRTLAIVQVKKHARVLVMVPTAIVLLPDNADILFVCADDPTKGAVLKALNVTGVTDP